MTAGNGQALWLIVKHVVRLGQNVLRLQLLLQVLLHDWRLGDLIVWGYGAARGRRVVVTIF